MIVREMKKCSSKEVMSNIVLKWKIALSSTICIALPVFCTLAILFSCGSDQKCVSVWQMVTMNLATVLKTTKTTITTSRVDNNRVEVVQLVEINQTNHHHQHLEGLQSISGRLDSGYERLCVLPDDCSDKSNDDDDRILTQLRLTQQADKIFNIFPPDFSFPEGQEIFFRDSCNINKCHITYNREEADLLVFPNSDVFVEPTARRREDQIWVAYFLESPLHTFDKKFKRLHRGHHIFNWTASYRSDSDIVTPYSKFVLYDNVSNSKIDLPNMINQAQANEYHDELYPDRHKKLIQRKRNKVAWFASNCNAANNRLEYARELSKYIPVDIYGK